MALLGLMEAGSLRSVSVFLKNLDPCPLAALPFLFAVHGRLIL